MIKRILQWLLLLFVSCQAQAEVVRVAVAANFFTTLKAIAPLYEKRSGDRLLISSASSGTLYAQIRQGAPYDILLSADNRYPQKLIDYNKAVPDSRFVYATGVLVLWSAGRSVTGEASLSDVGVKRIAIANPSTAPYGEAAKEMLQRLGLFEGLRHKLVQGESVAQTFQFVATSNAQVGFVALSQVLNWNKQADRGHYWAVPSHYYRPLQQEAVLLEQGVMNPGARRFMAFLNSERAQTLIKQYGYL